MSEVVCRIDAFEVRLDRAYHPDDHTWVRRDGDFLAVGMDALGVETTGDLAQLVLLTVGTEVAQGAELGSIEAQKFVGALRAPVAGIVAEVNDAVLADPGLVQRDPYEAGWLVLLRPVEATQAQLDALVSGDAIEGWFSGAIAEYRRQGVLAE